MSRTRSDVCRGPSTSVEVWRQVPELSVTVVLSCQVSTGCCTVMAVVGTGLLRVKYVGLRCAKGAPITLVALPRPLFINTSQCQWRVNMVVVRRNDLRICLARMVNQYNEYMGSSCRPNIHFWRLISCYRGNFPYVLRKVSYMQAIKEEI